MDPTQMFSTEVIEMIFGKLSGTELVKITLVSRSWNEFIGSSTVCMTKMTLSMRSDWTDFNEETLKVLKLTTRTYQHLLVSEASDHLNFVSEIVALSSEWKSMQIYGTDFKAFDVTKIITESVETVFLNYVYTDSRDVSTPCFNFSRLKSLTLSHCDLNICHLLLKHCSKVEILVLTGTLKNPKEESEVKKPFLPVFKQMKMLKKLEVCPGWFNIIFNAPDDEDDFPFQLEEFSTSRSSSWNDDIYSQDYQDRLFNFLKSHRNSLRKIFLGEMFVTKIWNLLFEMKKLKDLEFRRLSRSNGFERVYELNQEIPKSFSIETLRIPMILIGPTLTMKTLFEALPNLKKIEMMNIDEMTAIFMSQKMKNLQTIELTINKKVKRVEAVLPNVQWM